MSPANRLVTLRGQDPQKVRFALVFAAPTPGEAPHVGPASIEYGDGQAGHLGVLCAPSDATWRQQRMQILVEHLYTGLGPYTARLLWDTIMVEAIVSPGVAPTEAGLEDPAESPDGGPSLTVFAVEQREDRALERSVCLQAQGLLPGQQLRLDGGAGQVHYLRDQSAGDQGCERRLTYAKSGTYTLAVDLLDDSGYWVKTLAEHPVEILAWLDEAAAPGGPITRGAAGPVFAVAGDQPAPLIVEDESTSAGDLHPWAPFRYVRPLWGWLRTYGSPAGTGVSRVLAAGSYLSIRAETIVGDTLWCQTASQDWVSHGFVDAIQPSSLRGIELVRREATRSAAPAGQRGQRAVITAPLLNVRSRPGVRADNEPTRQLSAGRVVVVYEQASYGQGSWFRIGPAAWVHGSGVRLLPAESSATRSPASHAEATRSGTTRPEVVPMAASTLPAGWVSARRLNVRARPGIADDNQPIDWLPANQYVPILDSTALGSVTWYCVGDDRWVEGTWIRVARAVPRPAAIGGHERWVGVSLADQTLVAYEGDTPVYAAMVATGLPGTPTPVGIFRTYRHLEAAHITGGNPALGSYYDLEDVPWVCYFYSGYSLLGAYWHDSFGHPHSHGCVNLSPYDAWWIYRWAAEPGLAVYIS